LATAKFAALITATAAAFASTGFTPARVSTIDSRTLPARLVRPFAR
jgi:hypothetical protein